MKDLIVSRMSDTDRFIKLYGLSPNTMHLTLLFYQYAYLKEHQDNIVCSYLEKDDTIPRIVIMFHDMNKKEYILRRFSFNEDIYKDLEKLFNNDEPIVIDEALLKQFAILYSRFYGGLTSKRTLKQAHTSRGAYSAPFSCL